MNKYVTMLKTEIKLSFRGMDMVIFALCLPVVMVVLLGIIYGNQPAFEGASYSFLEQSFGAISTIAICAGGVMGLPLVISDYRQKKILKRYKVTPTSPHPAANSTGFYLRHLLAAFFDIGLFGRKSVLRRAVARFRGNLSGLLSSGDAFHIQHWNDGGRSRSEHEGREYCCQRFVFSHVDLLRGHSPIRGDADSIAEDFRYSTANTGDQIAESGFSGITDRSCLAPSGCHGGSDYYLRRNCGEILQVGIKK